MKDIDAIKTYLNISQYSKPYLSCKEQIILLKDRKLIIDDEEFALLQLETISYYALVNAYAHFFKEKNNDLFVDGTQFRDLFHCYQNDMRLKNLYFKYLILIEQSLKNNIAAVVAKNFGVVEPKRNEDNPKCFERKNSYLDTYHYDPHKRKRAGVLDDISKSLNWDKVESIRHYKEKHNHVPPWVIILPHNFGLTIKWLSILKKNHKIEVLKNISNITKLKEDLASIGVDSLNLLREFRNRIAHGHRFYSFKSESRLSLKHFNNLVGYDFLKKEEYSKDIGRNDLYALTLIILLFTRNKATRDNLIEELFKIYGEMNQNNKINLLESIGFTYDLIRRLSFLNENYL
ncbi:Abi family protein [Staphylococcus coagulans]|uniref:Abi family protein n=1 Tax=Staphylococcus coagulans TaxID=74706 RepID=UPI00067A326C|nr:Abi family protein [Staphylococcus coagulans]AKS67505.1 abortive phage resistance protein [Staphylococcus schleiferi]MBA8773881.1 Abi family protein [Staphylococcus coagulans]UNB45545.1 Abi family protein [Staphylococcus coagulans]